MRIAVAAWSARRVGGVEDYVSILLPALAETGAELAFWHEVDEPHDRDRIAVPPGVFTIDASSVGVDNAIARLREWRPDVIYSQGVRSVDVESRLLDIAPGVFFLHTYTGTCISGTKMFSRPVATPCTRTFGWPCIAYYLPRGCGGNSPVTMWRLFGEQSRRLELLRKYRAILTHTEQMRDEMTKHGLRAAIVPFAVEPQVPCATGHNDDRWRLLFAGRMERLKGGDLLLDALPAVARSASRPIHVVFAGDGTERSRWQERAARLQSSHRNLTIEFTGWITHHAVGALLGQTDLLVVPSVWPEPFGAVGIAAAQLGVPSVAFDVGGIPHWLQGGITGHLAPGNPPTAAGLSAAVLRCLVSPAHLDDLRRGAKQMSERFTIERHVAAVMTELMSA